MRTSRAGSRHGELSGRGHIGSWTQRAVDTAGRGHIDKQTENSTPVTLVCLNPSLSYSDTVFSIFYFVSLLCFFFFFFLPHSFFVSLLFGLLH